MKRIWKTNYCTKKKGNGYAIRIVEQRRALGNRSYLMPIVCDNDNIWTAKNEIFYTTVNATQMRGRTFLTQKGIKCMVSYWLNDNDLKEFRNMLPNFQL